MYSFFCPSAASSDVKKKTVPAYLIICPFTNWHQQNTRTFYYNPFPITWRKRTAFFPLDRKLFPAEFCTDKLITDADGWTLRSADGSRGAHSEHTVAITAEGPIVLTDRSFLGVD